MAMPTMDVQEIEAAKPRRWPRRDHVEVIAG